MTRPWIDWRSRPVRSSREYLALVEAAVAEYAERLWQRAAAARLQWLRVVLRRVRRALERIPVEARTIQPEERELARIIERINEQYAPPDLTGDLEALGEAIRLQYGFLPSDPRWRTLQREFSDLLRTDLSNYWRTLTDARTLARKLTALRQEGQTTAQIIRQVQQDYGSDYYSAERLVRTLYTAGANRAQIEALADAGYTHKRWLTARDARVRRAHGKLRFDHVRMDGVEVPINEPFITPAGSRLMYPGDRSLGAAGGDIINCRCTILGVVRKS